MLAFGVSASCTNSLRASTIVFDLQGMMHLHGRLGHSPARPKKFLASALANAGELRCRLKGKLSNPPPGACLLCACHVCRQKGSRVGCDGRNPALFAIRFTEVVRFLTGPVRMALRHRTCPSARERVSAGVGVDLLDETGPFI